MHKKGARAHNTKANHQQNAQKRRKGALYKRIASQHAQYTKKKSARAHNTKIPLQKGTWHKIQK